MVKSTKRALHSH